MKIEIQTTNYEDRLFLKIGGGVCPKCGKEDIIIRNSKEESSFINNDSSSRYFCMNCKWEEKYSKDNSISETLLTKEEWNNKNRSKLIDEMLSIKCYM